MYPLAGQFICSSCLRSGEKQSLPQPFVVGQMDGQTFLLLCYDVDIWAKGGERFLPNMFLIFTFILKDWRILDASSPSSSLQPVRMFPLASILLPSDWATHITHITLRSLLITCQMQRHPVPSSLFPLNNGVHLTTQAKFSYVTVQCAAKITL